MADDMDLREEDRLPWLETVEPDEDRGAPVGKVVALVVLVEPVVVVLATSSAGSASSPHATATTAIEAIRVIRANKRRIGGETTVRPADLAWWAPPRVRSAPV